jgi:hypothetical protein
MKYRLNTMFYVQLTQFNYIFKVFHRTSNKILI